MIIVNTLLQEGPAIQFEPFEQLNVLLGCPGFFISCLGEDFVSVKERTECLCVDSEAMCTFNCFPGIAGSSRLCCCDQRCACPCDNSAPCMCGLCGFICCGAPDPDTVVQGEASITELTVCLACPGLLYALFFEFPQCIGCSQKCRCCCLELDALTQCISPKTCFGVRSP